MLHLNVLLTTCAPHFLLYPTYFHRNPGLHPIDKKYYKVDFNNIIVFSLPCNSVSSQFFKINIISTSVKILK